MSDLKLNSGQTLQVKSVIQSGGNMQSHFKENSQKMPSFIRKYVINFLA